MSSRTQVPTRDATVSRLTAVAEQAVRDLMAVMLELDGARSLAADGPVADRIAEATAHVEALLQEWRVLLVEDHDGPTSPAGAETWTTEAARHTR